MNKYFPSYIRIPVIFFLVAGTLEYMVDSGDLPAFLTHPEVLGLLLLVLFVLIVFEACTAAINGVLKSQMTEEEKEALAAKESQTSQWFRKWMRKLTKAKPIEQEGEIILNHNYDGIRELDNALPPWWLYGFYLTIFIAVVYMAKYHILDGPTQAEEFEIEMEQARLDLEEYKKIAKDLVDENSVTIMTEVADLAAGKAIFDQNCAVCHKADGGGNIGPNLTDQYWILGGGIKNIFKTVSQGGRPAKGMEAWSKKGLKPSEIQQVSSYILTLAGTNPEGAKKAEGDLWVDESKEDEAAPVEQEEGGEKKVDTIQIK